MFLLNSILLSTYLDEESETLTIKPWLLDNLEHTFYYFRLGTAVSLNHNPIILSNKSDERYLRLEPDDFAVINTFEQFTLNNRVLGLLGPCTYLNENGIQLLHSPFIDPKFNGHLKFGIKNLSKKLFILEYGLSTIGKVSFFDTSDTYPIKIDKNSSFAQRFLTNK